MTSLESLGNFDAKTLDPSFFDLTLSFYPGSYKSVRREKYFSTSTL